MDSLSSQVPPALLADATRPPKIWKFWCTTLWGLFIFAAMFAGQTVADSSGPGDPHTRLYVWFVFGLIQKRILIRWGLAQPA